MKKIGLILILFISKVQGAQVTFESEVKVKKPNDTSFSSFDGGSKIDLNSGESLIVVTKKGMPILIHQPSSKNSNLNVTDANLELIFKERAKDAIENSVREILGGIRKVESLIQMKNFEQARRDLDELKAFYPNVSDLLFMSGTVNYLMNNKTAAIEDLELGLKLDPKNVSALKLLQQLRGRP